MIDKGTFSFIVDHVNSSFSDAAFDQTVLVDTRAEGVSGFKKCLFHMACDVGTHIDSPSHWFEGARDISELSLEELTSPGVVIDVTAKVEKNFDYELVVEDITNWEAKNGKIPENAFVCMKTGWDQRFNDHNQYMGLDSDKKMHFPGFGKEAAKFLIEKREIHGIGIDTASLDPGNSIEYPVHNIVLGADKYQIENMVLSSLPPANLTFLALPLRIKGAPEAEARVIAYIH